MKKLYSFLFFCFLLPVSLDAQRSIQGKVVDASTDEPIPFANVFLKSDYTKGVTTDYDGNFFIKILDTPDSLGASSVGYKISFRALPSGDLKDFTLKLNRSDYELKEVVIKAGENPAIAFMKKVIKSRDSHNKKNLSSYSYEAYNKMEIDLEEISEKFRNRKYMKPLKFVFNNIDSTSEEKPFLPFFLTESVSDYTWRKTPSDSREIIKASKVSGINDVNISQFVGQMYMEVDVYSNFIYLLQREFISPISDIGLSTYRYYIIDSASIDNKWCYKLQFFPKRKGELAFEGEMWVADSVFALKQINMKTVKGVDMNFVSSISMYNQFTPVTDSVWMLDKEKLVVHFLKTKKTAGFIGRKSSSYKDFKVNLPFDSIQQLFKRELSDIKMLDEASQHDEKKWNLIRHDTLSKNEVRVYSLMDSIKKVPLVKNLLKLAETVYLGYVDVGPVAIGDIFTFINYNQVEGWRLKYGMQTSNKFSKNIQIDAYVAYGIRDKRFKYSAQLWGIIKKQPREEIKVRYFNDITLRSNFDLLHKGVGIIGTFGLRRVEEGKYIPLKMLWVREAQLSYLKEFAMGYSFKLEFVNRYYNPQGNFKFQYQTSDKDIRKNRSITDFTLTEFSITHRFAWQEKFLAGEFNRTSLGSKYPTISLRYAVGVKRMIKGDFSYHKVIVTASDHQKLGPLGKAFWQIEAGRVFGRLPFLALYIPNGDESYAYNWSGFNTMREFEYAADKFVMMSWDHHLGGILLNRIPGIRKLKLREVWSARMFWGEVSKANRIANAFNFGDVPGNDGDVRIKTTGKVPFIEISAGIENIFKLIRIDAFWRVTHRNKKGGPFSFKYGNFGLRVGLYVSF